VLLSFGHDNGQNAILEVGSHFVLIDAVGEIEPARKLVNAALSEPVLGLVGDLLLLGFRLLFNFSCGGSRRFGAGV